MIELGYQILAFWLGNFVQFVLVSGVGIVVLVAIFNPELLPFYKKR